MGLLLVDEDISARAIEEYEALDSFASIEGAGVGSDMDMLGDVNGDGFDDFIIGSGGSSNQNWKGQAFVLLGNSSDISLNRSSEDISISFSGEDRDDSTGAHVRGAGDVNGDGFNDILVSSHKDEAVHGAYSGQTYLIFGRSDGWERGMDVSASNASFTAEGVGVHRTDGVYEGEWSGYAIDIIGDINSDGYDDIAIGAPLSCQNKRHSGKTYLIFGKPDGWKMRTNLSEADASFFGNTLGERSGSVIKGVGDANGDDIDDFIVGSSNYVENGKILGKVYLILGKENGWDIDCNIDHIASASFKGESDLPPIGNSFLGDQIDGPGDINGDGLNDILISNHIIFGRKIGWNKNVSISEADVVISDIGYLTGVGDVNKDGLDDFMYYGPLDHLYKRQDLYLFLGTRTGFTSEMNFTDADSHFADGLGTPYRVGDLNCDGVDDIAFSDPYYEIPQMDWIGRVYLLEYESRSLVDSFKCELNGNGEEIILKWELVDREDIIEVSVFRSFTGFDFHMIARLMPDAGTYIDTDVWKFHDYYYYILVETENYSNIITNRSEIVWIFNDMDLDLDGTGNSHDMDDDGDGVPDGQDMFPYDYSEWLDTDLDGIGNNADEDDDNDGIIDIFDPAELNPLDHIVFILEYINNSQKQNHVEIMEILSNLDFNMTSLAGSIECLQAEVVSVLSDMENGSCERDGSMSDRIDLFYNDMESSSLSLTILMESINRSIQEKMNVSIPEVQVDLSMLNSTIDHLQNLSLKVESIGEDLERIEDLAGSLDTIEKEQDDSKKDLQRLFIMTVFLLLMVAASLVLICLFFIGRRKYIEEEM
jgi:hypothetical protein